MNQWMIDRQGIKHVETVDRDSYVESFVVKALMLHKAVGILCIFQSLMNWSNVLIGK